MLLLIDNYDSFTYNLAQYFKELTSDVMVFRNDQITIPEIKKLAPDYIVISPGPGNPSQAGISLAIIKTFAELLPILGVCLGHQSLGQVFGGKIVHAKQVMHGKTSLIHHTNSTLFQNIPSPFTATRYHSLVIERNSLPSSFNITAWTETANTELEEIMAIEHKTLPLFGVQFHPESILTEYGHDLLKNFLQTTSQK